MSIDVFINHLEVNWLLWYYEICFHDSYIILFLKLEVNFFLFTQIMNVTCAHLNNTIFLFSRNFMYYLMSPNVIKTNPLCLIKSEVVNDRSEPTVDVSLGKIFYSFFNFSMKFVLIDIWVYSKRWIGVIQM